MGIEINTIVFKDVALVEDFGQWVDRDVTGFDRPEVALG